MSVQIVERNGEPEWAILPYDDFLQLVEQAEMLQGVRDYDAVKDDLKQGDEELIPSEVVYVLLDGSNPIKTWRVYRGLSQQELASSAEISVPYLSQLESGKRTGSVSVISKIAIILKVTLDDIANRLG